MRGAALGERAALRIQRPCRRCVEDPGGLQFAVQTLLCGIAIGDELRCARPRVDADAQDAGHLDDHRRRRGLCPALPRGQRARAAVHGDVEIGGCGERDGGGVGLQLRVDALHRGKVFLDAGQHRVGERDRVQFGGQLRQLILDLVDARNPGRQPVGLLAGDTRLRRRAGGVEAPLGAVECGAGLFGRRRSGRGGLPCAGLLLLGLGTPGLECDQGLGPALAIGDQLPALGVGECRAGARRRHRGCDLAGLTQLIAQLGEGIVSRARRGQPRVGGGE